MVRILGIIFIAIGIPMLVCPGPGLFMIGAGMTMLLTGRMAEKRRAVAATESGEPIETTATIVRAEDDGHPR